MRNEWKKDQRPKTTKGLSLRDRDADESVSRAESELQKRAVPTIEMGAVLLRVRGFYRISLFVCVSVSVQALLGP